VTVNGGGEAHGELTLPPPQLTTAGVPLTGIPLLPLTEGYYFTADNVGQAVGCYREFMAWTDRTGWWGGRRGPGDRTGRPYLSADHARRVGIVPMLAPRLADRARPACSNVFEVGWRAAGA